ncbi:hypothetical protein [Rhodopseudomonas palustris]|uniref:hypothetical protein n=1 Tax=Rhodopseudomonas palustris TaxID=1076 RepID=UPI0005A1EF39|nr:hypothetical protein [Rhodopseudomonas palustris]
MTILTALLSEDLCVLSQRHEYFGRSASDSSLTSWPELSTRHAWITSDFLNEPGRIHSSSKSMPLHKNGQGLSSKLLRGKIIERCAQIFVLPCRFINPFEGIAHLQSPAIRSIRNSYARSLWVVEEQIA